MATSNTPPPGGGSDGPGGDLSPEQRAEFQRRADEIGKRLDAVKSQVERGQSETQGKTSRGKGSVDGSGMGRALRVSTELIGGILVGSAIGWALDTWLKTQPLFFIAFFFLGSAAGMMNVVRASRPAGPTSAAKPGPAPKDDDDES
jgi:ATP synthase protein I